MAHREYVARRGRRDARLHAEMDIANAELTIGEALVRQRHEQGHSLDYLAEVTGLQQDRLEAIESGESMSLHEVLWLLHALDLSIAVDASLAVTTRAPQGMRRAVG